MIWRIALRTTIWITTCHRNRFAVSSRCSARLGSGFSPTPSRTSRGATAWTRPVDRGGTAASPTGSLSSKGSNAIPSAKSHFQRGVTQLRIGLGVVLVMAILLSFVTQLRVEPTTGMRTDRLIMAWRFPLNCAFQPGREFWYSADTRISPWLPRDAGAPYHETRPHDKEVVMPRWPIRLKLIAGLSVVVGMMLILMGASIFGLHSFHMSYLTLADQLPELGASADLIESVYRLHAPREGTDAELEALRQRVVAAQDALLVYFRQVEEEHDTGEPRR